MVRQTLNLEYVRSLYYAYFHASLTYGIIFWGNSPSAKHIFKLQKRVIRIMFKVNQMTSCRSLFKILHVLPLPSIYISETLKYVKSNLHCYRTNAQVHTYNTRKKNDLSIIPHSTSLYNGSFIYTGLRMYNILPSNLKELPAQKFKQEISKILHLHCFYSVNEYLDYLQEQQQQQQ